MVTLISWKLSYSCMFYLCFQSHSISLPQKEIYQWIFMLINNSHSCWKEHPHADSLIRWPTTTYSSTNLAITKPYKNTKPNRPTWCPTACKFLFGARLVNYPDDVREEATEYNSNRQHRQDGARERNNWGEQNKTENKTEQNREQSNWDRIAQLGKQKQGSSQAKYKLLLLLFFFLLLLVLLL